MNRSLTNRILTIAVAFVLGALTVAMLNSRAPVEAQKAPAGREQVYFVPSPEALENGKSVARSWWYEMREALEQGRATVKTANDHCVVIVYK